MIARALPTPRQRLARQRQHGAILQQPDRRALERAGWRTTLEFRENNIRGRDGRLLEVQEIWLAEAERGVVRRGFDDGGGAGDVEVIQAMASSADGVWAKLHRQAELAVIRRRDDRRDPAAVQAC